MKVIHALQPIERSIFLAGPTPRSLEIPTWRKDALRILDELGFTGTVFVPESADWAPHNSYDDQVNWEWDALAQATVVVFWIPRDIKTMPGFTTNVEFGLMVGTRKKVVLGFPSGSPKNKYLESLAREYEIPVRDSLVATLETARVLTDW